MLDKVLEKVEEQGREERIPMLGPDKARLQGEVCTALFI